jgi:hypothetical protein
MKATVLSLIALLSTAGAIVADAQPTASTTPATISANVSKALTTDDWLIPPSTYMRIELKNGQMVYGCAGTLHDSSAAFDFSQGAPRFAHAHEMVPCNPEGGQSLIRLSQIKSVALARERSQRAYIWPGALIGAAIAYGSYWSLGSSKKICHMCFINTGLDWTVVGGLLGAVGGLEVRKWAHPTKWIEVGHSDTDKSWTPGWIIKKLNVQGTAGAGFAGLGVVEVLKTDSSDKGYVPVRNHRYDWRPAISTGLVAYLYSEAGSNVGAGVGVQIVSLPTSSGVASPFPGITVHIGTPANEFFLGMVFAPSDSTAIPLEPGTHSAKRQLNTVNPESFIHRNTSKAPHLYMGIQLKGTRQGGGDLGIPESAKIVAKGPDTATAGETVQLQAFLVDSAGAALASSPPQFDILEGKDHAEITGNTSLRAKSAGEVWIRVRFGRNEDLFKITIIDKKKSE